MAALAAVADLAVGGSRGSFGRHQLAPYFIGAKFQPPARWINGTQGNGGKKTFGFHSSCCCWSLVYLVLYLLFSRLHIKIGDYFETINTKTFFNKTFCRSETSANPYTVFTRRKDNKDLIQCPTPGCDGMGHSTGNYSTHRR